MAAGVTLGLFAVGVGSRLLRLLAMTLAGLTFLLCIGLSSPARFSLSFPFAMTLFLFAPADVAHRGVTVLEVGVVGLVGRCLVGFGCALGCGDSADERLSGLLMGMLDWADMVRSKRSGVPTRPAIGSGFRVDLAGDSRSLTS